MLTILYILIYADDYYVQCIYPIINLSVINFRLVNLSLKKSSEYNRENVKILKNKNQSFDEN